MTKDEEIAELKTVIANLSKRVAEESEANARLSQQGKYLQETLGRIASITSSLNLNGYHFR